MPPKAEQISKDTAGEFATIRRANVTARANSIVTDSKKPNPLKSIKLIRSNGAFGGAPGPSRSATPVRMDFSKLSLKKIPLITSSMPSIPAARPDEGSHRRGSTPPQHQGPRKLPRLTRSDVTSSVSPSLTPQAGQNKVLAPQSHATTTASTSQGVRSRSPTLLTNVPSESFLSRIPIIKFESQAVDALSDPTNTQSEEIENSIEEESQSPAKSVESTKSKSPGRPKKNKSNSSQPESPKRAIGRPKRSSVPPPPLAEPLPRSSRSTRSSTSPYKRASQTVEPNDISSADDDDDYVDSGDDNDDAYEGLLADDSKDLVVTMNIQLDKPPTKENSAAPNTTNRDQPPLPQDKGSDEEFYDAMDVDLPSEVEVTPAPGVGSNVTPVVPNTTLQQRHSDGSSVFVDQAKINKLQNKILPKINGKTDEEPYCINDKILDLEKLLKSVVVGRQSHSCVVFGPRNSGKTAAFKSALRRVREDISKEDDFIYININGLAQDTDTLAVRAIADQLDTEITRMYNIKLKELEANELLSRKSITNTFANVLKVLDDEVTVSGDEAGKLRHPIIFCIDEVDVYAQQNKQTLLYNLFDLAENSKTPICVVCFTSKFTFKELLEKRVRSRFSQRTITFRRLPQERFLDACAKLILVDDPENDYEEEWNRDLLELVQDRSSSLRKAMVYNHLSQANIKEFQNQCVYPIAKLSVDEPRFSEANFAKYAQNQSKSSFVRLVNSLSDLESFLLVCAARVIVKTDMSWVNLNIVYEEYLSQLKAQQRETTSSTGFGAVATTGFKTWSKEACKHPWETLRDIGFLTLPGAGAMKSEFANSTFETRMWQVELTLDELRRVVYTAKAVKTWTRL